MRFLVCLILILFAGSARAQTIPATLTGPLTTCEDRGGWIEGDRCFLCPKRAPQRSGEDPTGPRACTRLPGTKNTKARRMRAAYRSERSGGGRYICSPRAVRDGVYCYTCPISAEQFAGGKKCKVPILRRWTKAKELDPSACSGGAWLGADQGCYRCPIGTYRMTGLQPSDPGACHLDFKGEMRAALDTLKVKDKARRARVDPVLETFFANSERQSDDDRYDLMQQIIVAERKHKDPPRLVIWLRPEAGNPDRSVAVAMMGVGRNPIKWSCYRYRATIKRLSVSGLETPTDTIVFGWGGAQYLEDDQMVGLVERTRDGVFQGYDWSKFPQARRLVWEIGGTAEGDQYYRHIRFDKEGLGKIDCAQLTWN